MASFKQFVVPIIQIVGGTILTVLGLGVVGVPLIISGVAQSAVIFLTPTDSSKVEQSPTYTNSLITNRRGLGGMVPIIGGEIQVTPLLISIDTETEDDEQILKMLYLIGEGPAARMYPQSTIRAMKTIGGATTPSMLGTWEEEVSLEDRITLNDTPLIDIDPEAKVVVRDGTATQSAVPGFDVIGISHRTAPTPPKLDKNVTQTYSMVESSDAVKILVEWRSGLHKNNGKDYGSAGAKFEYRPSGGDKDTWKPIEIDKTLNPGWKKTTSKVKFARAGWWLITGNTFNSFVRILFFQFPEKGKYDLRFTGILSDDANDVRAPTIPTVIEIQNSKLTYPNRHVVGVIVKVTEQIQGTTPIMKIITKGLLCEDPRDGVTKFTRNNALILRQIMLSGKRAQYIDATEIHDASGETFRVRADDCDAVLQPPLVPVDEKRYELDVALDTQAKFRDWVQKILLTFRSTMFYVEGQYRLAPDLEPAAFAADFSDEKTPAGGRVRNIVHVTRGDAQVSTLQYGEIVADNRWNLVIGTFLNRDDWQRDTVEGTYNDLHLVKENKAEFFLIGTTRETEAKRFVTFLVRKANLSQKVATWQYGSGHAHLLPGEGVRLYTDDGTWTNPLELVVQETVFDPQKMVGQMLAREFEATIHDADKWEFRPEVPPKPAASTVPSDGVGGEKITKPKPNVPAPTTKPPKIPGIKIASISGKERPAK